jgi:hypothetical protein
LLNLAEQENIIRTSRGRFVIPGLVLALMTVIILATDDRLLASVHDVSEMVFTALQ